MILKCWEHAKNVYKENFNLIKIANNLRNFIQNAFYHFPICLA